MLKNNDGVDHNMCWQSIEQINLSSIIIIHFSYLALLFYNTKHKGVTMRILEKRTEYGIYIQNKKRIIFRTDKSS